MNCLGWAMKRNYKGLGKVRANTRQHCRFQNAIVTLAITHSIPGSCIFVLWLGSLRVVLIVGGINGYIYRTSLDFQENFLPLRVDKQCR
jgi:hypothetical protein